MVLMGIRTVTIGWSIEGNIGAKYWKNDVNVDYAIYIGDTEIDSGSFNEPQEWTDLMIGIRSKIYLNKSIRLWYNVGSIFCFLEESLTIKKLKIYSYIYIQILIKTLL